MTAHRPLCALHRMSEVQAVAIEGLTVMQRGRHRARSAEDVNPYLHYRAENVTLADLVRLLPILEAIGARATECRAVRREIERRLHGGRVLRLADYQRKLDRAFPMTAA